MRSSALTATGGVLGGASTPSNDANHDHGKDPEHPQQDANSTAYVCVIRINERQTEHKTYREQRP